MNKALQKYIEKEPKLKKKKIVRKVERDYDVIDLVTIVDREEAKA